eukprot:scaffold505552_cov25-Prasinocladus_malaysianus.AAC.1
MMAVSKTRRAAIIAYSQNINWAGRGNLAPAVHQTARHAPDEIAAIPVRHQQLEEPTGRVQSFLAGNQFPQPHDPVPVLLPGLRLPSKLTLVEPPQ